MKKTFLGLFTIALLILFEHCNTDSKAKEESVLTRIFPQYSEYLEKIVKTDSSIIRGLNLNVSQKIIKHIENTTPSLEKKDTLEFQYQIDSLVSYTVKYLSHNDSLEEINIWIYTNNPDISSQIFSELKDYYQKKLPDPIEDKGYVVYNCVQGERRPFVVSISDFSIPNKGQINLVIYKDK